MPPELAPERRIIDFTEKDKGSAFNVQELGPGSFKMRCLRRDLAEQGNKVFRVLDCRFGEQGAAIEIELQCLAIDPGGHPFQRTVED